MLNRFLPLIDLALVLLIYPTGWIMKMVRKAGFINLPRCRRALLRIGVFPITNHYYEPQFDFRGSITDFAKDRNLPGITLNEEGQLKFLESLRYSSELQNISESPTSELKFYFNNAAFESGDAEYWYQVVRAVKPKRIIEVGSGFSTMLAIDAISMNKKEDSEYSCEHTCIEPYEMPWLERTDIEVLRKRVEEISIDFFLQLDRDDILFIDSSHIIRPDGDVLFEYLELLPSLNEGVIVHIHDIFTPKNYLNEWIRNKILFWNEQYLLEAFLTDNPNWEVIGALNFLHHRHFDLLKSVSPYLTPDREPGSFYMRKAVKGEVTIPRRFSLRRSRISDASAGNSEDVNNDNINSSYDTFI